MIVHMFSSVYLFSICIVLVLACWAVKAWDVVFKAPSVLAAAFKTWISVTSHKSQQSVCERCARFKRES